MPATVTSAFTRRSAFTTPTAATPDIVVIHGLAEENVGVRVEPLGQLLSVVLEIRLNGVAAALQGILFVLRCSPEAILELCAGPVRVLTDPPRQRQAVDRASIGPVVVATPECRVGTNGPDLQRRERDLIRARGCSDREDHGSGHTVGLVDAPLEDPHTSHGASDDGGPRPDPEGVGQGDLDGYLVSDGDDRES